MKFKESKKVSKPENFMGRVPEAIILASIVADIALPFFLLPSPPLNEAPERIAKIKLKKCAARSVHLEKELANKEKEHPSSECNFCSYPFFSLTPDMDENSNTAKITLVERNNNLFLPAFSNESQIPKVQKISDWHKNLTDNGLYLSCRERVD